MKVNMIQVGNVIHARFVTSHAVQAILSCSGQIPPITLMIGSGTSR